MDVRIRQANQFNETGNGYDILVASDAIGMGLNLNIRRIIFHNVQKHHQHRRVDALEPSIIKQLLVEQGVEIVVMAVMSLLYGAMTLRLDEAMKMSIEEMNHDNTNKAIFSPTDGQIENFHRNIAGNCNEFFVFSSTLFYAYL